MHVAGNELREGVDHGDDGLAEIGLLDASGAPQGARAGHIAAMGGGFRAIFRHGAIPLVTVKSVTR
ncbi:hypothetical protein MAIT1_03307 [Magnetofaba australis IT-1]|uniref:Uncharacterized protein n=1 Tax=Magnetofaba australis IT-1 TaxID=1434232 RepID=A0A1Y2K642_9PROT|nr:hypothetical protein MAIT1_03307 [Magnetofaba australis IT-1]